MPRGDINGVGEDEVTVTSGHTRKQKEQANQQRRKGYIVTSGLHTQAARTKKEQTEESEGYSRWTK